MKRTHDVLDYLARRRTRNWLRRALSTPSQLIPLLLLSPVLALALMSAVAVLFIPSFGLDYEKRALVHILEYRDAIRTALMVLLVMTALGLIHRSFEGDVLAFRQADVDFLFPAPLSRTVILLERLLTDYAYCGLATFVVVMYVLMPLRVAVPGTADALWAIQAWMTTFLFYVFVLAVGRVFQALFASRVDGMIWARAARIALFAVVALVGVGLAVDSVAGDTPFSLVVRVFSSRVVELAFLPCKLAADGFVAPFTPGARLWPGMALLFGGTLAATGALLLFGRPACESTIAPTARKHAIWQAFQKADASSIRAAQLMGRSVRGWRGGLPPLGRGAFALVGKSVLYGWRNSPWGVAVVAVIMLAPIAMGPTITEALEDSDVLSAADLQWLPFLLLGLVFAWSQRIRLIAREEFGNLAFLKCLPAPPHAIVAALLCVPTATFSLFMAGLGLAICVGMPAVDPETVLLVVAVTPALYAASGAVHMCSSLLFPVYDPSLTRTYAADLAMMPVVVWVFASVLAVGGGCLSMGMAPMGAAAASIGLALAYLAAGLWTAGALFRRFEPGA